VYDSDWEKYVRDTTNWLLELTDDEGKGVLRFLDVHKQVGHRDGYDDKCLLCRATSRISLGRDYGIKSMQPETVKQILRLVKSGKL
jgi:hypothetical protein